jgi:hypothetical protein
MGRHLNDFETFEAAQTDGAERLKGLNGVNELSY